MNLRVHTSHLSYAIHDVAGLNPKDAESFDGHILVAFGENGLVLPVYPCSLVKPNHIGLNLEQRRFLGVKNRDVVDVKIEAAISRIGQIALAVNYQFQKSGTSLTLDLDSKIKTAVRETFCFHPFTEGHKVTLELDEVMLSLEIKHLFAATGRHLVYGCFDNETEIKIL